MSSIVNPQSEPPTNEELVAYLDGELPPDDCRRVEDRLAADDDYRQELRDLDQAWEALSSLPTTSVDDGFARTTIELACVAAAEDLSHRTARATAETRRRSRWWIAAGVVSAVMGFVMMRALAVHRNNAVLADLPVIGQANVLTQVADADFLRQLSSAVSVNELVKDEPAFKRDLAAFASANAESLGERREWVNSLSAEQKANLAERARAFEELRHTPEEKKRLRTLTNDIRGADDAEALQSTLVAYGQWLSRHTPGQQEQLRDELSGLATNKQVDVIQKIVRREDEQAARHLSPEDVKTLRDELLQLAQKKKSELIGKMPPGRERERIANQETTNVGQALIVLHAALRSDENGDATIDNLINKLSPAANEHWKKLGRWRRDARRLQLWQWIHDALQPKWTPQDLERFFVSERNDLGDKKALTNDEKARLLEMPRAKMEAELEQRYLSAELGIDDRLQFLREFGEAGRGPRNGPGPEAARPGAGPQGRRPEGPPPDERFGPGGQPPADRDRNRPPGQGGKRGPRPEDRRDGGRPGDRPGRGPNDQRPPDGPPPPGQQPPPPDEKREPV